MLENASLLTQLQIEIEDNAIILNLTTDFRDFSEFGLNLPFNFMGKKMGGNFDEQYLFNSPYRSIDEKYKYCYLKNIKGKDVFVIFLSDADGWKMDYSPWVSGHYFVNLKCLANFDRAYETNSKRKQLKLALLFADSFEQGLEKIAKLYNAPLLFYDKSYTFNGKGKVRVYGRCDRVDYLSNGRIVKTQSVNGKEFIYSQVSGKIDLVPFYKGVKGLDCSVFGYADLNESAKKANDAVVSYAGEPNLGNLCECQFWASAMMRYMLVNGRKQEYDAKLKEFFNMLLPENEESAVVRLSVLKQAVAGLPEYSVYKSRRIQEHFAGVSILLDAYKLYGEQKFLDYAIGMLDSLIDNYQEQNGGFFTGHIGEKEDYSTVTCLMLAIVDMAIFFKDKDQEKYQKYYASASALAQFIYNRGISFPTEGGNSDCAEEQMEDGAISCSALSLLYYAQKLERKENYILKAKEIMDMHDAWVMKTPDCNIFYSSLRWWETRWEGDKDGPALCSGHGWTIWRAEADFWYYRLTGDKEYLHRALNGFTTNFSKFNENGQATAIYHADYISGGGFQFEKDQIKYEILNRFPKMIDVKTSRYVYVRAYDTVFTLSQDELND